MLLPKCSRGPRSGWPSHGWLGLALVAVFWTLNWWLSGLRTQWAFFPLWLGYCLSVDALVVLRKGDSLLTRNPRAYAVLFVISSPGWWLFEVLNWRTQNWLYLGAEFFTPWQYFALTSLCFSTVMPAVFGTAELVGTFRWVQRIRRGPAIVPTQTTLGALFATGGAMLALLLMWPQCFFPFLWLSLVFILEPINVWLGNRSLLSHTAAGDWRPIVALCLGCLICAFFWEMWNFWAYPKWVYQIPVVGFWRVFEMPLLGYGGYVPFSWELFALYHLVTGVPGLARCRLSLLHETAA